jgi:adenosylcobyric acid synthase
MLGRRLIDPAGTDGPPGRWPGLDLLAVETTFGADKHLVATGFTSAWPRPGEALAGYEIHRGRTAGEGAPLVAGAGAEVGAVAAAARVVGCYLHGLLQADGWRRDFLNVVRADRGLPARPAARSEPLDLRIARWTRHVTAAFRGDAHAQLLAAARA